MAVQKTKTMFLDGEEFARKAVLKEYARFEWTDDNNPPEALEVARVFAVNDINTLEVEIPEGADGQFYYGIQYYLELIQGGVKSYRARKNSPAKSIRVTF